MNTITIDTNLTKIDCGQCGGVYAINERYRQQKKDKGGYWNCPYCNCRWGYGESEVSRLQRALDAKKRREEILEASLKRAREEREAAERRAAAQKAANTRMKNRISKGVCPCCKRHFANLHRHMTSKHPNFATGKAQPHD